MDVYGWQRIGRQVEWRARWGAGTGPESRVAQSADADCVVEYEYAYARERTVRVPFMYSNIFRVVTITSSYSTSKVVVTMTGSNDSTHDTY